jgi:hypothetical protein
LKSLDEVVVPIVRVLHDQPPGRVRGRHHCGNKTT